MQDNEIKNEELETPIVENVDNNSENTRFADRVAAKRASMPNGFKKGMYVFFMSIAVWFVDFIDTFKRNKIKIGAFLIATPGIFIGFLMNFEIDSIMRLGVKKAPICLFALTLCGYINIFEATVLTKKKNLFTVIIVSLLSLIITVTGFVYIIDVINVTKDQNLTLNSNNIISFIIIGMSIALSLAGCVIGFIFRDKNYKKDKF